MKKINRKSIENASISLSVVGGQGIEVAFGEVDAHADAVHPDGHLEVTHQRRLTAARCAGGPCATGEVRRRERLQRSQRFPSEFHFNFTEFSTICNGFQR